MLKLSNFFFSTGILKFHIQCQEMNSVEFMLYIYSFFEAD